MSGIVYSALKALRHAGAGAEAPVHVRVKPINACNHHCWYCAYRSESLQLGDEMRLRDRIPDEKLDELARDMAGMGVKAVTFSGGGEPLLHPRLPQAVETLAAGGVRVAALTNGALLTGAAADAFAARGTWVRVSIDAWDGPSYAASRGVGEGEFDRVLGNLEAFARRRSKCALGVSFIVGHANAPHLAEFCARASSAGVASVKVSACVVGNTPAENNAYHAEIEPVVARQLEECRRLERPGFVVVDHYHRMDERFDKKYVRCASMPLLTVIGADCSVYSCQDKAYTASGRLGSIQGRLFSEFWRSSERVEAMSRIDPSRHCRHHCVAHSKNKLLEEYAALDLDHADFV